MSLTEMQKIDRYIMGTYKRSQVMFLRGRGCTLIDDQGREYLDLLAGIAVCNLGHAHPAVTKAICDQALSLNHVSNLFYTEPQARVAELLVENSFADQVFFCNSGAEANEGALKLARLWGKEKLNGAFGVISMERSFHGRTFAALSATGQEMIQKGYDPLAPVFKHVPFGDFEALSSQWDENTCAVMMEPVQGEGGVVPAKKEYLEKVRKLCDEKGALLIFDEVQTGLGRTGKLFAYEHFGITPDIMTLAKALANGLPAGAVLAKSQAADLFGPGTHGTTFGAGPVVMAAAREVMQVLTEPGFMDDVAQRAAYFKQKLEQIAAKIPDKVLQVRGLGFLLGLKLCGPGASLVTEFLEKGFVVNCTQGDILRFVPPLIITKEQIDAFSEVLLQTLIGWDPGQVEK